MTAQHYDIPPEEVCKARHQPIYALIVATLAVVSVSMCMVGWSLWSGNSAYNASSVVASDLRVEVAHTTEYRTSTDAKLSSLQTDVAEVKRGQNSIENKLDRLLFRSSESAPASAAPPIKTAP